MCVCVCAFMAVCVSERVYGHAVPIHMGICAGMRRHCLWSIKQGMKVYDMVISIMTLKLLFR